MGELLAIGAVVTVVLTTGWLVRHRWSARGGEDGLIESDDVRDELWNFELRRRILTKQEQVDDLRGEWKAAAQCGMTAADMMTEQVIVTPPDATLAEIRELMQRIQTRHVLICEPADHLIGVVSDRDLSQRSGKTARDIMTPNPLTVSSTSPVTTALVLMVNNPISCIPVVDRDKLRGILTTTDLMMALECLLEICEERLGIKALAS